MKTRRRGRRRVVQPLEVPADKLYARLLTRAITRLSDRLEPSMKNALLGAIRARQWTVVVDRIESHAKQEHGNVVDHYVASQLEALVKKYPFTREELPGFDPEAAAWKKFQSAEHRCKRVNQRQAALRDGDGFAYAQEIGYMRAWIRRVIGVKPNYRKIYDLCFYGPGASVGVNGDLTSFARKILARQWTVTRSALSITTRALWQHAQIRDYLLRQEGREFVSYDYEKFSEIVAARVRVVSHNNVSFVPKSYKTKRSIATEPLLNGYIQKGIDEYLRLCLRKYDLNLDLRDQIPNQEMARWGSLGGSDPYATIDLSSASDSMSTSIVRLLLPPAWFDLLDRTRSHFYRYRGGVHPYHKFVSMGNGFCFPLQTLLFAAASYACYKTRYGDAVAMPSRYIPDPLPNGERFRVYGDDIIVRRSVAAKVLELLRYLGFRHNPDKTYLFGPFRESCGTDWYSGQDVRPVYLDYRLTVSTEAYKFHNATLATDFTFPAMETVREELRAACPEDVRFVRPVHGVPEGAFTVPLDTAMADKRVVFSRTTWAFRWTEVKLRSVRDKLREYEEDICNTLEYYAVLRGSSSSSPFAVRRKTRASVGRLSYWGLPGHEPWKGADADRVTPIS